MLFCDGQILHELSITVSHLLRTILCSVLVIHVAIAMAWGGTAEVTPISHPEPTDASWFGWVVAPVGDLDGDGVPDRAVSAPRQLIGEVGEQGVVFVFSGRDNSLLFTLNDPLSQGGVLFGHSVVALGDINGDALPDLAISARLQNVDDNQDQGRVFLFSGADLDARGSQNAIVDILDAPTPQAGAWFGASMALAGDVNADGVPDVLVGAGKQNIGLMENAGEAYLFSVSDSNVLCTLNDPDPQENASFGTSVALIGDVNVDGIPDFVVGVPLPVQGQTENARALVFSGDPQAACPFLYRIDVSNVPTGVSAGGLGTAMSAVDDLDGDGIHDILLGAPAADGPMQNQGRAFVFSGIDGTWIRTLEDPTPMQFGAFGASLASIGDVDGDGMADIGVGLVAQIVIFNANVNAGRVVVFSGATGELLLTIENPSPEAAESSGSFGSSLADVGDIDGDGVRDLLIGAPLHDVVVDGETISNQGEAFLVSGLAPDLKAKILEVVRTVTESGQDRLEFSVEVKNRGAVKTTVPFKVKAHISDDATFDGGKVDPKVSKWKVEESLLPGEVLGLSDQVTFDESVQGKFLIVRVDIGNVIAERKEQNNLKAVQIPN